MAERLVIYQLGTARTRIVMMHTRRMVNNSSRNGAAGIEAATALMTKGAVMTRDVN